MNEKRACREEVGEGIRRLGVIRGVEGNREGHFGEGTASAKVEC